MTEHGKPAATGAAADGRVTVEVVEGVATVEFHHPKSNSLPGSLLAELAGAITRVGARADARVIVLRSAGDGAFCGGASFEELTAVTSAAGGTEFFSGFARVILAMIRTPQFILTRVHGKAAGGGVGLVAASDYSLAVRSAAARLSELALGLGPFVVGPCIERKIGLAAFSAMSVDADWRDAEWCERHGLYSRLHDDIPSMDAALAALAATLARSNPEAMKELKRAFWAGTEDWPELLTGRAALSGRMVLSDYTRRAIEGFRAR